MKIIIIILISLFFVNTSYGFMGFFESKEKDPRTITDHDERMNWLRKHNPKLFEEIDNGNKQFPKENESAWKEYIEMSKQPWSPEIEKKRKEQNMKELREAQIRQNKANEEKMKQGYKFVNGELISLEEQKKLQKEKEKKQLESRRIINFYKEMNMELPKDTQNIKIKDE